MKSIGVLGLFLVLTWAAQAETVASPDSPAPRTTQKYVELAGTYTLNAAAQTIFRSNGHEYLLVLNPDDPGVKALKVGMAIIVKGTVTIVGDVGKDKKRTLRPTVLVIRGRTYTLTAVGSDSE